MAQLTPDEVPQVAQRIMRLRQPEQRRLWRIGRYMRGFHDSVYVPRGAKHEYKWLMERSVVNYLPLVVSVVTQQLHIDGIIPSSADADANPDATKGPWQLFVQNRLVSKQRGIFRSLAKYGVTYAVVLPGQMDTDNDEIGGVKSPSAVIRGVSPRRLTALYEDDVDDEWPLLATEVRQLQSPKGFRLMVRLYDENFRYTLTSKENSDVLQYPEETDPLVPPGTPVIEEHGLGVCPVVRFLHEIDLDGEMDVSGEAEPLIPLQDQLNTSTFNLMMIQQFGAFRQRWVTGMVPDDEAGRPKEPFRSGIDRLFVAESPDTKFGEFGQSDTSGVLASREASIRHMSTIAQVPPYHLLGQIANLSAEALAAARDGLDRKTEEQQGTLTEPWRQTMRLASRAAGDSSGWQDDNARILWRDTGARAFAATVDALGKMATMLGVPVTELWKRVPGVTAEEITAWEAAAEKQDAMAELDRIVEAALTKGNQPGEGGAPGSAQGGDPAQTQLPDTGQPYQAYAGVHPGGV